MKKNCLLITLTVLMILFALPCAASANGDIMNVATYENLRDAFPQSGGTNEDVEVQLICDIIVPDKIVTMGKIIVPDGKILTILERGYVEAEVEVQPGAQVIVKSQGTLASTIGGNITNNGTITVERGGHNDHSNAGTLITWKGGKFINGKDGTLNMNGNMIVTTIDGNGNYMPYVINNGQVNSSSGYVFMPKPQADAREALENIFDSCTVLDGWPIYREDQLYQTLMMNKDQNGNIIADNSTYRIMYYITVTRDFAGFQTNLIIDGNYGRLTVDGSDFYPKFGGGYDFIIGPSYGDYGTINIVNNGSVSSVTQNEGKIIVRNGCSFEFAGTASNYGSVVIKDGAYAGTAPQGSVLSNYGEINIFEGGSFNNSMGGKLHNTSDGNTRFGNIAVNGTLYIGGGSSGHFINDEGCSIYGSGIIEHGITLSENNVMKLDGSTISGAVELDADAASGVKTLPQVDYKKVFDITTLRNLLDAVHNDDNAVKELHVAANMTVPNGVVLDTHINNAKIVVEEGVTFSIANGAAVYGGVVNYGTITVKSGGTLGTPQGSIFDNYSVINIESGSALIVQLGSTFTNKKTVNGAILDVDGIVNISEQHHGKFYNEEGAIIRGSGYLTKAVTQTVADYMYLNDQDHTEAIDNKLPAQTNNSALPDINDISIDGNNVGLVSGEFLELKYDTTVSEGDITVLTDNIPSAYWTALTWFNLDLYKVDNTGADEKLNNAAFTSPIEITIGFPVKQNVMYKVIHKLSDGNIEILDTIANIKNQTLKFSVSGLGSFEVISRKTYYVTVQSGDASKTTSITLPPSGSIPVSATVTNGTAKVDIPQAKLEAALANREKEAIVDLSGIKGVTSIELSAQTLQTVGAAGASVTIKTENGTVTLDAATLNGLGAAGEAVKLTIEPTSIKTLTKTEQGMVGTRPVLKLSVAVGTKQVTNFDGSVTVTVPYKKAENERAEGLCVWFLDGGKLIKMPAIYDPATDTIAFTTPHFSTYVIGYFPFTDIADNAWYYGDAAYAYINTLFSGTSETEFSPETPLTRAMLWTVLARFAGIDTAQSTNINYYDAARAWTIENGITDGTSPNGAITREQLVTTLYRCAKLQQLDTTGGMAVREFDDYDSISDYAKEAMSWAVSSGLVQGSENRLMPQGGATRAQVAAMLHRFAAFMDA